jgi:hypothetical protein
MDNLSLKDFLFRVYTKFTIADPSKDENLKNSVQIIEKCNLTDLVRLLVFGCKNGVRCNPLAIKDDFLNILYDLDGKSSPLAISLLKDKDLYKVDLGRLLSDESTDESDTSDKVSLSTFILILLFYSSQHYINIAHNIKLAIERLLHYAKNSYLSERFPQIKNDEPVLRRLLDKNTKEINPSRFLKVIQGIGKNIEDYVKPWRSSKNETRFIEYWEQLAFDIGTPITLEELMDAMFELFMAGYFPASISSVFPDTVLAAIPGRDVSGQLDYLLLLDKHYSPRNVEPDEAGDNLVRVVFLGSYADKSLLFEYEPRWRYIEERLPGIWRLFRIIYKRLQAGEYNTDKYLFSTYKFIISGEDESVSEAAKVRWFNLFSSFILGHVINLIGIGSNKQVYKVAAPVINIRNEGSYLVPVDFYKLELPIVRYKVSGDDIIPDFVESVKWLRYRGDNVYTPTSSSVSDIASYDSSYAIVINSNAVSDVSIDSYAGDTNDWNEVVEAEIETQGDLVDSGTIDKLSFKLYDDKGEVVNIRLIASSTEAGRYIEPGKVDVGEGDDYNATTQE